MNSLITKVVVAFVLTSVVGCSMKDNHKTQKQAATQQWNSARAAVLASLASDQFKTGNFDKCRESLDEALRMDPKNVDLHILSARVNIETGRLELAEAALNKAAELAPKNGEIDYLLGTVNQRWQKLPKAEADYAAAIEKQPDDPAYLLARAEAMVLVGKQEQAISMLLERVVFFEHSAAIRDALGQMFEQSGKLDEAIEYYRQASVLNAEDDEVRQRLSLALFSAGRYRDAIAPLNRLLKKDAFAQRTDLLLAAGQCLLELNSNLDARGRFEAASQANPSLTAAWQGVAKASLRLRDYRRAEFALAKAIAITPSDPQPHVLLGYSKLEQGKLDEAMLCFRRAIALDSRDAVSLAMTGFILQRQGRRMEAVEWYGRALAVNPSDPLASQLMASVER